MYTTDHLELRPQLYKKKQKNEPLKVPCSYFVSVMGKLTLLMSMSEFRLQAMPTSCSDLSA